MSNYDHKAVPQQSGDGGYKCALCNGEVEVVHVLGTSTWFHKDETPTMQDFPGERRSPVKTFTRVSDDLTVQQFCKNRREALFNATHLDFDGYDDENSVLETAEKFERWLNRPQGEFWFDHDDDKEPIPLRVVDDETQEFDFEP